MARAFISLGSNIEPEVNLPAALSRLARLGSVAGTSRAYASSAVGPPGQPDFVNAAALLETDLSPEEIRAGLRGVEAEMGRGRSADRYAPRPIDLDLVLYDNLVIDVPGLRLPDPDLLERAYLAATIAELDPGFTHPVTGERLSQIAARLAPGVGLTVLPLRPFREGPDP